jgi:hypothetical protein
MIVTSDHQHRPSSVLNKKNRCAQHGIVDIHLRRPRLPAAEAQWAVCRRGGFTAHPSLQDVKDLSFYPPKRGTTRITTQRCWVPVGGSGA